jgi:transglutaminase-like putative cysteine protease
MATRSGKPSSRKKAARKPSVAAVASAQPVVTIRARDRKVLIEAVITRVQGSLIEHLAQKWAYILRVRTRWNDDTDLRQSFGERALADLGRLGVSHATIRQLISVLHIEVELHEWAGSGTDAEQIHEAASEIPWEYLLSTATRSSGRHQPLLITRLVRNGSTPHFPPLPRNMLFVQSAPGRLNDEYGFDTERVRIQAAIGLQPQDVAVIESPTVPELKAKVRSGAWDAIHVTGVDTHQVTRYISDLYDTIEENRPAVWKDISDSSGRVLDGMILRQRDIPERPVCYKELAATLLNGVKPPSVITLNLYHSGARTARELVARGAYAALGFLDEIDDDAAELFFQAFYSRWCSLADIFEAFLAAWHEMDFDSIHGTAIVIWTGSSVFEPFLSPARKSGLPLVSEEALHVRPLDDIPIWQLLQVELEIDPEINYSLLHNDRQLIEKLTLTKLVRDELHNIVVLVELNLGAENYPYRCTHTLFKETQLALAPDVKIPLTAKLPRSLRERVHSTVYVKIACGGRTAFEDTRRVTLIPVDEWLDDTDNNPWLPSFVLPRDPAVLKIVNSSRQYLIGIADDPAAGFDGYQSVDSEAPDPSAGVDAQVRAIWTAIVNEYRLQYINPPPAYSELTQRLRTPSDVLASNTGTCIDLALLLASCLEYIDIYPVVVLLTGHAFVGYWRSEEAHDELVSVKAIPRAVAAVGSREAREAAMPYVDRYGWRLTKLNYDEIMKFVMAGKLSMLEATYLTGAYKFADAIEEGRANMRSRKEFDSLLDLRLARTAARPVTPLPIINE